MNYLGCRTHTAYEVEWGESRVTLALYPLWDLHQSASFLARSLFVHTLAMPKDSPPNCRFSFPVLVVIRNQIPEGLDSGF
jgi:hypothetical protein